MPVSNQAIEQYLIRLVEKHYELKGESLLETLKGLDTALSERRTELPPKLVHYLERRSYEKALQELRTHQSAEA